MEVPCSGDAGGPTLGFLRETGMQEMTLHSSCDLYSGACLPPICMLFSIRALFSASVELAPGSVTGAISAVPPQPNAIRLKSIAMPLRVNGFIFQVLLNHRISAADVVPMHHLSISNARLLTSGSVCPANNSLPVHGLKIHKSLPFASLFPDY
jgi:hypothetical protein